MNLNLLSFVLSYCINKEKNNCAIRLSIGPPPLGTPSLPKNYNFIPNKGSVITEGSDGIIFSYGQIMINQAYKARRILLKENIKLKIVNIPCVNSFNKKWLKSIIGKTKYLFFLEDHNINGGLSDLMISFITNDKILNNQVLKKFAPNEFPACGTPEEVLKYHKLDEFSLASKIKKILKNKK